MDGRVENGVALNDEHLGELIKERLRLEGNVNVGLGIDDLGSKQNAEIAGVHVVDGVLVMNKFQKLRQNPEHALINVRNLGNAVLQTL